MRIQDLDKQIPPSEFYDNDYMTPEGQRRLAAIFERVLNESRTPKHGGRPVRYGKKHF